MQERRVYYLHRYKTRKFPATYMACITDGMDQKTTNVPRVRRLSPFYCGNSPCRKYYPQWPRSIWQGDLWVIWLLPVATRLQSYHISASRCPLQMVWRVQASSRSVLTIWQLCKGEQESLHVCCAGFIGWIKDIREGTSIVYKKLK